MWVSGYETNVANIGTADLRGHELHWGCSVLLKNELHVFGVHEGSPYWSGVSENTRYEQKNWWVFKILKLTKNCKLEYLTGGLGYTFHKGRCAVLNEKVWLCFGHIHKHSCKIWTEKNIRQSLFLVKNWTISLAFYFALLIALGSSLNQFLP